METASRDSRLTRLSFRASLACRLSAVRDYLNRFPRYGLLERGPSGSWVFKGFTEDFAEELCEVRSMFELRSALRFISLADEEPAWAELSRIRNDHFALLEEAETRFTDFSALDERFHRCINDAVAQPVHRRFLRRDLNDLPLSLPVE